MKIDTEKVNAYLKNINVPACSLCGNDQWILSDSLFCLREFTTSGVEKNPSAFPVVAITCEKCGYTHFINAIAAGLIEKQKESSDKDR